MKRIFGLLSIVMTLCVAGCATPYQSVGVTGGYIDRKIDDQTYHVQFSGNGYTPADKVHKYFMYRCAELTTQAGYKYFTIIPAAMTGAVSAGNHLVSSTGFDPSMMRKVATHPIVIYSAGGVPMLHAVNSADIRMFNDDAIIKSKILAWQADEILDQLGPYVRSGGQAPAALPQAWMFEPDHGKVRAEDLLPTSPTKNPASGA